MKATPCRDMARASSTGSTFDHLRSESLRMDETAPVASSALRSRESPSPTLFDSGSFLSDSFALREGDLTLLVSGFQTVMGTITNGCPTASPKGFFTLAAELERGYVLKVVGASDGGEGARSGFRTCVDGEDEDAPNF